MVRPRRDSRCDKKRKQQQQQKQNQPQRTSKRGPLNEPLLCAFLPAPNDAHGCAIYFLSPLSSSLVLSVFFVSPLLLCCVMPPLAIPLKQRSASSKIFAFFSCEERQENSSRTMEAPLGEDDGSADTLVRMVVREGDAVDFPFKVC
jgi:hypothetical protein